MHVDAPVKVKQVKTANLSDSGAQQCLVIGDVPHPDGQVLPGRDTRIGSSKPRCRSIEYGQRLKHYDI